MQTVRHLVQFSRSLARIQVKNVIERKRYMCTKCSDDDKFIVKQQISFVDTKPAASPLKTVELQIDWDEEMQAIYDDEERENSRSVLAPVEDENSIYAEPMIHPSFNLAAYVQKSDTLQQLMKLGVELYKLDRLETGEFIVNLDFKRDIEPHILFLNKNIGIPIELMGKYLTQNPNILKESLDDIQTRVNYLELKRFTRDEIVSIVTRNAIWLNKSTRDIDELLGFFQNHFKLNGNQVRLLTVTYPRLITHNLDEVQKISFSVREECCFEDDEVKQLLLKCPKLWMLHRFMFMERYDFVKEEMKISNAQLVWTPQILKSRLFRVKERHGFLKKIGRAQYNPKLELYISLDDLVNGNDEEFMTNLVKRPYEEYDRYLRTL